MLLRQREHNALVTTRAFATRSCRRQRRLATTRGALSALALLQGWPERTEDRKSSHDAVSSHCASTCVDKRTVRREPHGVAICTLLGAVSRGRARRDVSAMSQRCLSANGTTDVKRNTPATLLHPPPVTLSVSLFVRASCLVSYGFLLFDYLTRLVKNVRAHTLNQHGHIHESHTRSRT